MKTALSKFDEILVKTGRYPSKRELIEDAFRSLLRAKPERNELGRDKPAPTS